MKKVRKIDVVQEEREKKKLRVVAYCRAVQNMKAKNPVLICR